MVFHDDLLPYSSRTREKTDKQLLHFSGIGAGAATTTNGTQEERLGCRTVDVGRVPHLPVEPLADRAKTFERTNWKE
jgi:hypothetical protein